MHCIQLWEARSQCINNNGFNRLKRISAVSIHQKRHSDAVTHRLEHAVKYSARPLIRALPGESTYKVHRQWWFFQVFRRCAHTSPSLKSFSGLYTLYWASNSSGLSPDCVFSHIKLTGWMSVCVCARVRIPNNLSYHMHNSSVLQGSRFQLLSQIYCNCLFVQQNHSPTL